MPSKIYLLSFVFVVMIMCRVVCAVDYMSTSVYLVYLYVFVRLLLFLLLMAFDSAYTLYRILLMSLWEHTKILLTVRWDIYLRLMRGRARRGKHAHMREQLVNTCRFNRARD